MMSDSSENSENLRPPPKETMLNKFWNQKPLGLISAIGKLFSVVWNRWSVKWHSFIYTRNLGSVGQHVRIYKDCFFRNPKTIHLGNGVYVGEHTELTNVEIPTGILNVEDGVSIDMRCRIDYSGGLEIGQGTHIAWGTYIITHTHGYDHNNAPEPCPLRIGKNVFIGAKVIITPNVATIGDNAMIGTGSVVTKDVPENAVVAGNPARIIKYRELS